MKAKHHENKNQQEADNDEHDSIVTEVIAYSSSVRRRIVQHTNRKWSVSTVRGKSQPQATM